jgi:hypothetical protein
VGDTVTNDKVSKLDNFTVTGPQLVELDRNKTYEFMHGLKRVPLVIQVQFSPDSSFDDVHIVQWPWAYEEAAGPVSIRADTGSVYLEFFRLSDARVFGAWSAATGQWQRFTKGYFRVITS